MKWRVVVLGLLSGDPYVDVVIAYGFRVESNGALVLWGLSEDFGEGKQSVRAYASGHWITIEVVHGDSE